MLKFKVIIVFIVLFLIEKNVFAKVLIFDLSQKNIEISKNDNEPDFIIFGFTDSSEPLVIKIKGPEQKVILQKKTKVMGMWSWKKTGEFIYPGLFHYYTNKNSKEIDFQIKKDLFDNIKLVGEDNDNLKRDLIEKKMSIDLFLIENDSFKVINEKLPNFFKIPITLPKNSPSGEYSVSLSIMDSLNNFQSPEQIIIVEKLGLSSFVFKIAHKYSFIYGILSAIIAIGLGFFAGIIFRK
jgi:hypothetical protein